MLNEKEYISIEEAQKFVRAPDSLFRALLVSGLLGYVENGQLLKSNVDDFAKYGTQWNDHKRLLPQHFYGKLPEVDGVIQPPGSTTEVKITPSGIGKDDSADQEDEGWIAQFYIIPNQFFFPSPSCSSPILGTSIKLNSARTINVRNKQVILFPDKLNNLALLTVLAPNSGSSSNAYDACYDIVGPILDELSFEFDSPLPVSQSILIGVPSGVVQVRFPKPTPIIYLDDSHQLAAGCSIDQLQEATSLYREAVSSNNPFHQFLSFWKVYENVNHIRAVWRKSKGLKAKDTRKDVILVPEVMPLMFVFDKLSGKSFSQAREHLRDTHRNAVAHGALDKISIKTPLRAKDVGNIENNISIVRYIARISLQNTRATLEGTR